MVVHKLVVPAAGGAQPAQRSGTWSGPCDSGAWTVSPVPGLALSLLVLDGRAPRGRQASGLVQTPAAPRLPAMWANPLDGRVKCVDRTHHWTSLAFYAGSRSAMDCVDMDSGDSFQVEQTCHGGGFSLGAYHYMEVLYWGRAGCGAAPSALWQRPSVGALPPLSSGKLVNGHSPFATRHR